MFSIRGFIQVFVLCISWCGFISAQSATKTKASQSTSSTAPLLAPFSAETASTAQAAWAKQLRSAVETSSKTTGMKLRLIPPGEFLMGTTEEQATAAATASRGLLREELNSEQPQHRVQLTKPFLLGTFEVTQTEYKRVMGRNPSKFSKEGAEAYAVEGINTSTFPVENVSWYDAIEFCNKLSVADGLKPYYKVTNVARKDDTVDSAEVTIIGGKGYRLPTEAEWEYACRAGTITAFHFGDTCNGEQANIYGEEPFGTTKKGPHKMDPMPVGTWVFPANQFGLRDMHGNAREWCQDTFEENFYHQFRDTVAIDPVNLAAGDLRVLRGGSFTYSAAYSRSSHRNYSEPNERLPFGSGFRVARTP